MFIAQAVSAGLILAHIGRFEVAAAIDHVAMG
jgi:hypothetical protein